MLFFAKIFAGCGLVLAALSVCGCMILTGMSFSGGCGMTYNFNKLKMLSLVAVVVSILASILVNT